MLYIQLYTRETYKDSIVGVDCQPNQIYTDIQVDEPLLCILHLCHMDWRGNGKGFGNDFQDRPDFLYNHYHTCIPLFWLKEIWAHQKRTFVTMRIFT